MYLHLNDLLIASRNTFFVIYYLLYLILMKIAGFSICSAKCLYYWYFLLTSSMKYRDRLITLWTFVWNTDLTENRWFFCTLCVLAQWFEKLLYNSITIAMSIFKQGEKDLISFCIFWNTCILNMEIFTKYNYVEELQIWTFVDVIIYLLRIM